MTRLSRSRPNWSVPNQNWEFGPSSSLPWCCSLGSNGEISGAEMAPRTSNPRIENPRKPSGLRHVRTRAALSGCVDFLTAGATAPARRAAATPEADPAAIVSALSDSDAWIDQSVREVHQQVDDD